MRSWVDELADELDGELLVMDGFDEAIVGVFYRFGQGPVVAYDRQKVLELLEAQGMSWEEAIDFHQFNQAGAWVGDATPGFLDRPPR